MAENYFDPTEEAPVARDTSSADASKSGVRAAWDQWTSKPENNAALLQFGIAMMQPRAQGQSSVGQFGNAIGEAGEASTRNVAAQNQELDRAAQREERLSTAAYRTKQGDAALMNAGAYGRQVDNLVPGGAGLARTKLSQEYRTQQAFRTWLQKSEDILGADPLVGVIKKEFPGIQNKSDLVGNGAALKRAYQIYAQQFNTEPPDDTGAPPAATQPPNTGVATPPSPNPPVPGARYYNGHWYTRGPNGEAVQVPGF